MCHKKFGTIHNIVPCVTISHHKFVIVLSMLTSIRAVEKNECVRVRVEHLKVTSADGVQKSFEKIKRVCVNFISIIYMWWSILMLLHVTKTPIG